MNDDKEREAFEVTLVAEGFTRSDLSRYADTNRYIRADVQFAYHCWQARASLDAKQGEAVKFLQDTAAEGTANERSVAVTALRLLAAPPAAQPAEPRDVCPTCNGAKVIGSPGEPCPFCYAHELGKRYKELEDAAPQAQAAVLSVKRDEWASLSPEAQAALLKITGAGVRAEVLARAQAAQSARSAPLLSQAQPSPHFTPAEEAEHAASVETMQIDVGGERIVAEAQVAPAIEWTALEDQEPLQGQYVEVMSESWSRPKWLLFDAEAKRLRDPVTGMTFWYPSRMKWRPGQNNAGFAEQTAQPAAVDEAMHKVMHDTFKRVDAGEVLLRRLLCRAYAGPLAYMDDGEAQDNRAVPPIDFLRDTPAAIEEKMRQRASAPAPAEPFAHIMTLAECAAAESPAPRGIAACHDPFILSGNAGWSPASAEAAKGEPSLRDRILKAATDYGDDVAMQAWAAAGTSYDRLRNLLDALSAEAAPISDADIRRVFLAHGFTIKPGCDDLKPYVYEAARALLEKARNNA